MNNNQESRSLLENQWKEYQKSLAAYVQTKMSWCRGCFDNAGMSPEYEYYRTGKHPESTAHHTAGKAPEISRGAGTLEFLLEQLSHNAFRDKPLFWFNDPPNIKSLLPGILAARLAQDERHTPVLIPCRELNLETVLGLIPPFQYPGCQQLSGDPVDGALDAYLRKAAGTDLEALHSRQNVVLLFNDFEEIPHLSREKLGRFIRKLTDLQKRWPGGVNLIIAGKNTLLHFNDPLLPGDSHVLSMLAFPDDRIQNFSACWNRNTGDTFDGMKYARSSNEILSGSIRQPFLLALLAKLHTEGIEYDPDRQDLTLAEIFRDAVSWCCRNIESKESTISGGELRAFLQAAGFAVFLNQKHRFTAEEVRRIVRDIKYPPAGVKVSKFERRKEYTEGILLIIPDHAEGTEMEFLHDLFGEYCAAEFIAERIHSMLERTGDDTEQVNNCAASGEWFALFCHAMINHRIQSFLEPMLGCWESFREGRCNPEEKQKGLTQLLKLCGTMYQRLLQETDREEIAECLERYDHTVTLTIVNCLINTLYLGSYCARKLSASGKKIYFNLEAWAPGSWWHTFVHLLHIIPGSGEADPERLFRGISLDDHGMVVAGHDQLAGLYLPYIRIPGFSFARHRMDLLTREDNEPRSYSHKGEYNKIVMDRSVFDHGDLSAGDLAEYTFPDDEARGASFVAVSLFGTSFRHCNLSRTDFHHCNLQEADFTGADLTDASVTHSFCRNALFRGADLTCASLKNTDCTGADFSGANLCSADLSGVNFTNANLAGANLTGAETAGAIFIDAVLPAGMKIEK